MIGEFAITGIGIALSFPALIEEYSDDFASGDWETYVKLLPQLFLIVAIALRLVRYYSIAMILSVVGLALVYFCMLFNSSASGSAACEEYTDICADEAVPVCQNNPIEPWQGVLYLIGLSLMTVGGTLMAKETMALHKLSKTAPR